MPTVRGPVLPQPVASDANRALGVPLNVPWEPRKHEKLFHEGALHTRWVEWIMDEDGAAAGILDKVIPLLERLWAKPPGTPGPPQPDPPGAWHMSAVGDFGSGTVHESNVANTIRAAHPQLIITVGDNVYTAGREQDYERNFDSPTMYGTLSREVPFFPTVGNHDERYTQDLRPYFARFPQLRGNPYYAFTYRNADFVALDTDQDLTPGSAQYRWLEHELATNGAKATWRVLYMHYPIRTVGGENFADIRAALLPLLKRYHVQLLLSGHVHDYQRFQPMDGTTCMVIGNGGEETIESPRPSPADLVYRTPRYGHIDLAVGATSMVVRAVDENGALFDTDVIQAGRQMLAVRPPGGRRQARRVPAPR
jgi:hypothetical protein